MTDALFSCASPPIDFDSPRDFEVHPPRTAPPIGKNRLLPGMADALFSCYSAVPGLDSPTERSGEERALPVSCGRMLELPDTGEAFCSGSEEGGSGGGGEDEPATFVLSVNKWSVADDVGLAESEWCIVVRDYAEEQRTRWVPTRPAPKLF